MTVITANGPNLLFYVTHPSLSQSAIIGLVLTITGFMILSAGFVLVVHYDRERSWHLKQIEKSPQFRSKKPEVKTANEILREYANESKRD
jgi:hypothetical protein